MSPGIRDGAFMLTVTDPSGSHKPMNFPRPAQSLKSTCRVTLCARIARTVHRVKASNS